MKIPVIPVYELVNGFLDTIQPNDLSYMEERGVDFSDGDSVLDSFTDNYEEWIMYFVGTLHLCLPFFSAFFSFRSGIVSDRTGCFNAAVFFFGFFFFLCLIMSQSIVCFQDLRCWWLSGLSLFL